MINTLKLKAAITEAGYTQAKLSEATGIKLNTLNAKITGKSKMYVDEAFLICDVLKNLSNDQKVAIFLSNVSQ